MKKTFVYICRSGPNQELRYSLRSVDAFYPDADVWIVGGKPEWYIGNYIEVEQQDDPFENVRSSLDKIVNDSRIPNDIIIMNDDFFFVRHVETFAPYISGTLRDKIKHNLDNGITTSYVRRLERLNTHCKRYTDNPLDFDIHVPIHVKKNNLSLILDDNVMWRSNYGNRFIDPGSTVVMDDVKVYPRGSYFFKSYDYLSKRYPFFSTQDSTFVRVHAKMLRGMFPARSKFEA